MDCTEARTGLPFKKGKPVFMHTSMPVMISQPVADKRPVTGLAATPGGIADRPGTLEGKKPRNLTCFLCERQDTDRCLARSCPTIRLVPTAAS